MFWSIQYLLAAPAAPGTCCVLSHLILATTQVVGMIRLLLQLKKMRGENNLPNITQLLKDKAQIHHQDHPTSGLEG